MQRQKALGQAKRVVILSLALMIIFLPFITLYWPKPNASSPVQAAYNTFVSSAAPTVIIPNNPVQNNFLVVEITTENGGTINSVTDTLLNTFTQAVTATNTYASWIYIAQQTHTTGADTITATFAAAQANITISVQEMSQITSVTPTVTSSGTGTTGSVASVTAVTPNLNDACFTAGMAHDANNNPMYGITSTGTSNSKAESSFGVLFQIRTTPTMAQSYVTYSEFPLASTSTIGQIIFINRNTGSLTNNLNKFNEVLACFPQAPITTSTTTTTTITTSTTTGTIVIEPAASTDTGIIIGVILAQIFFSLLGIFAKRVVFSLINIFFLVLGVVLAAQLQVNPTLVYGSTQFLAPNIIYLVLAAVDVLNMVGIIYPLTSKRF